MTRFSVMMADDTLPIIDNVNILPISILYLNISNLLIVKTIVKL